jgi:uncharacterized protein
MRILVDVLHPAHVHFFRHFAREMDRRGHAVIFTARDKDGSIELLRHYDLAYALLSRQGRGTLGLARELFGRTRRLVRIAREWKPDVMTGIMGPSIALAGRLLRVPAVVFYDTEFAWQTNWFVYPLAHSVCTPDCYEGRVRGHHVTYAGYHELAYLHPNRFTRDPERVAAFGVSPGEHFSIIRFVSWQASHDVAERGLDLDAKRRIVQRLLRHGRVFVSSEGPMPQDLEQFRIRGPYGDIHHLLAYADLMIGESATMASEAAVLGVPAIFIAETGRGYTNDQEHRYGLVHKFRLQQYEQALMIADDILQRGSEREERARDRLLKEKIDVTAWMVRYFEETVARPAA